jgi:hypothetical protein
MRRILSLWLFLFAASAGLRAAEKYAVLIGIDKYQSERIQGLKYSEADAGYLKDVLIRYARFKPQNVHILMGKEATAKAIKSEIFWLGKSATPADEVLFYFSGHGTRVKDEESDEEDGMDEAFCPVETDIDDPASVILDDEIGYWFERIKSSHILVVLDCCHSGGAAGRSLEQDGGKGLEMAVGTQSRSLLNTKKDLYARDLTGNNKFIITASDAAEQSYENPKLGHGVFTYYLGEAIEGMADANHDKSVDLDEMYNFTKTKTLEFAKTINRTQTPNRFGTLDNVVVSRISKQLCNVLEYDPALKTIRLEMAGTLTKPGDTFILRKRSENYSRDLEIADQPVMIVEIDTTFDKYCEGKVAEEMVQNAQITTATLRDYYAEKLCSGSMFVLTEPWSTVVLDGREIGTTPVTVLKVPEGRHELEFKIASQGYPASIKKEINVEEDKKLRIVEKFLKQP